MKSRGKILALLLLTVWMFQGSFPWLYYQAGRYRCQATFRETKENLANKEVCTFTFSKDPGIRWEKKNKEFCLNGKYYDVISMISSGRSATIRCYADSREDRLHSSWLNSVKDNQKNNKDNVSSRIQNSDYLLALFRLTPLHGLKQSVYKSKADTSCLSSFIEILSPPPES